MKWKRTLQNMYLPKVLFTLLTIEKALTDLHSKLDSQELKPRSCLLDIMNCIQRLESGIFKLRMRLYRLEP